LARLLEKIGFVLLKFLEDIGGEEEETVIFEYYPPRRLVLD